MMIKDERLESWMGVQRQLNPSDFKTKSISSPKRTTIGANAWKSASSIRQFRGQIGEK